MTENLFDYPTRGIFVARLGRTNPVANITEKRGGPAHRIFFHNNKLQTETYAGSGHFPVLENRAERPQKATN